MPRYIKYVLHGFTNAFGTNKNLYHMEATWSITQRINEKRGKLLNETRESIKQQQNYRTASKSYAE